MNRRKPALKLGPRAINRNTPDKETSKNGARSGIGLGLLGSYGDDSDDGLSVEDDYSDEEAKLPKSTLDSKVADFLKEIDDLGEVIPVAKPKKQEKPPKKAEIEKTKETAESDFKITWGSWQQCVDESTQHPYYWNTETNEVTWIVPEEIARQYDSNVTSVPSNEVKPHENPAEIQKKEEPPSNHGTEDSVTSRTSVYPWEENDQKNDFDIDAELDNALQSKEKSRSRKHDVSGDGSDETPTKRKKFHPFNVSETVHPSNNESKTDDKEIDLEAKTELWQQWEDELSNKEEKFKSDQDNEGSHTLKEARKSYDSEEKDESEDEDLSKYDMMAMDESTSPDHQKHISNDEDSSAEPSREEETQEKSAPATEKTESTIEEYIREKVEIEEDLLTTLSKLECLKVTRDTIPVLQILAVEVETRMTDWKAGELSDNYVRAKLEDCLQKLKQHEKSLMPVGWTCHWDSRFKRYYFTDKWGGTQWDFPVEVETEETKKSITEAAKSDTPIPQSDEAIVEKDILEEAKPEVSKALVVSKGDETSSKDTTDAVTFVAVKENSVNSSLDVKNGAKTSLKADGSALPSDNKENTGLPGASPYPGASGGMVDYGSYNVQNYYWNMQNYGVQYGSYDRSSTADACDENFRNSPMHDQPPPPPGEDVAPLPPSVEQPPPPPLPPGEEELVPPPPPPPPEENDDGIEMEISDAEEGSESHVIGELQPTTAEVKKPLVDYSTLPPPPPPPSVPVVLTGAPVLSSAPVMNTVELSKPLPATQQPTTHAAKPKKTKKVKKEKTALKKPPKQMFGMVAKWQKAKQDIEDEEQRLIMESEMELDRETDVHQRIEQWKMEQLQSGKAAMNANFQPVSDDWKKRVKQRKNKIT